MSPAAIDELLRKLDEYRNGTTHPVYQQEGLRYIIAQWAAGQKEEMPPELFDGHAVWIECGNVQSQDVTRVLDSIVKLIRKRQK